MSIQEREIADLTEDSESGIRNIFEKKAEQVFGNVYERMERDSRVFDSEIAEMAGRHIRRDKRFPIRQIRISAVYIDEYYANPLLELAKVLPDVQGDLFRELGNGIKLVTKDILDTFDLQQGAEKAETHSFQTELKLNKLNKDSSGWRLVSHIFERIHTENDAGLNPRALSSTELLGAKIAVDLYRRTLYDKSPVYA